MNWGGANSSQTPDFIPRGVMNRGVSIQHKAGGWDMGNTMKFEISAKRGCIKTSVRVSKLRTRDWAEVITK
jgi:hypothetical protein